MLQSKIKTSSAEEKVKKNGLSKTDGCQWLIKLTSKKRCDIAIRDENSKKNFLKRRCFSEIFSKKHVL